MAKKERSKSNAAEPKKEGKLKSLTSGLRARTFSNSTTKSKKEKASKVPALPPPTVQSNAYSALPAGASPPRLDSTGSQIRQHAVRTPMLNVDHLNTSVTPQRAVEDDFVRAPLPAPVPQYGHGQYGQFGQQPQQQQSYAPSASLAIPSFGGTRPRRNSGQAMLAPYDYYNASRPQSRGSTYSEEEAKSGRSSFAIDLQEAGHVW